MAALACWHLRASIGSIGRVRRGLSRAQRRLRRRPEFGPARRGGCSALAREQRSASGPWGPGEHARATGASGKAPGHEVRRPWRWPELDACGGGSYGTRTSRGSEGKQRGAHGGSDGGLGELGEASGRVQGRRRSRRPKLEEEVGEAAAGHVRSCGLAGTV